MSFFTKIFIEFTFMNNSGYRPKIEITMTTNIYKQQLSAFTKADIDWLDLLSFRFEINGESSLKPINNGDVTTITLDSPVNSSPQIFGITSVLRSDVGM